MSSFLLLHIQAESGVISTFKLTDHIVRCCIHLEGKKGLVSTSIMIGMIQVLAFKQR